MVILRFFKYVYYVLVALIVSIAIYAQVTGNNPVQQYDALVNAKYPSLIYTPVYNTWNRANESIMTPSGYFKLVKVDKILGQNSVHGDNPNTAALLVTYSFTATKDKVKTNTLWDGVVTAKQGDKVLEKAVFFQENTISPEVRDDLNQAVTFVNEGETIVATIAYAYDPNGLNVEVDYASNKVSYPTVSL